MELPIVTSCSGSIRELIKGSTEFCSDVMKDSCHLFIAWRVKSVLASQRSNLSRDFHNSLQLLLRCKIIRKNSRNLHGLAVYDNRFESCQLSCCNRGRSQ